MTINEYRLRVMDFLIYSRRIKGGRESFVSVLNNYTFHKDVPEIGINMFDKHLRELKSMAADDDVHIKYRQYEGYYYSKPGYRVYEDVITDEDKHLLAVAASIFNIFRGTPLQDKFGDLVSKVLSETHSGFGYRLPNEELIQMGAGLPIAGTQWLSTLLNAIADKKSLHVQYESTLKKKINWRHISPYLLKQYKGRWYFIGYHHESNHAGKTLVYSLSNIKDVKNSEEPYQTDPQFDPQRYFKYSIGIWHSYNIEPIEVVMEFSGNPELLTQTPLHHTQQLQAGNGTNPMRVIIKVYQSEELVSLLLSYGEQLKVISPAPLVEQMKEKTATLFKYYHE
jgi:predicted DNA-binding transcriptional regulator YafY